MNVSIVTTFCGLCMECNFYSIYRKCQFFQLCLLVELKRSISEIKSRHWHGRGCDMPVRGSVLMHYIVDGWF